MSLLKLNQSASPRWAQATDAIAENTSDIILLLCRVGLLGLFWFSVQGKLANMEGFAAGLATNGVPGGLAMAYLAVTVEIVGAVMVLFGLGTRYGALLLALFVVVASLVSHRYWDMPPAQARAQMTQFYKNVSIISAYLLLFVTGAGKYSLDHLLGRAKA